MAEKRRHGDEVADEPAAAEEGETWTVDQPMELHKLISERHARESERDERS